MERLTNVQGLCIECIDCNEKFDCEAECNAIDDCIKKLAAYEDTGLTPDQVRELAEEQQSCRWIPVEERLPEAPEENPVFDGKEVELYLVTVKGGEYPFRAFWNGREFTDGWMDEVQRFCLAATSRTVQAGERGIDG